MPLSLKNFHRRLAQTPPERRWAGAAVGWCFVGRPSPAGEAEIGYAVLPAYRGCGYTTEAAAALVGWAFACAEVVRVTAEAEVGNGASVRVLEKCGFVRDGVGMRWGG